jgi:hypothetical protein
MGEVVGLKLDIVAGGALHPFEDVEASKACKAGVEGPTVCYMITGPDLVKRIYRLEPLNPAGSVL